MTQRLLQQHTILAALAQGATVVTAGERLARAAQWAHAEAQQATGRLAWERPGVLPWPAFLAQLWSTFETAMPADTAPGVSPRILSAIQAEAVWESVVRRSGSASGLLQPRAAAQAAQEAWALCQSYRLDPTGFAGSVGADAEQFSAWATAFGERCRSENWLNAAELPQQLALRMQADRLPLPGRVVFAGFHEWTPQQQQFLQSLRQAGCEAERLEPDAALPGNARRVSCMDSHHELQLAALWAGALLEQNPAARIGIVVHDLGACAERMRRALDDALCPSARLGGQAARPYNLSLGGALADAPVIHDALLLLGAVAHSQPDFNSVSQLLRSPFLLAADTERAARARLELRLRAGGERVPLNRLIALARVKDEAPQLVSALSAALKWRQTQPNRQTPSAWARGFAEVLRLLGWPGERTQDSNEYQAVESFSGTLGELARLDMLAEAQDMGEALSRLTRLAAQAVFQPAAEEVPVQVLGVLEAADLYFDHLWIAGWSDDVWPASPRPNPLIPVSLQRRHDMPHAGAQRELEYAQRVSARLLAAAPEVVVSAPRQDADRELRPSPLIVGLPETGVDQVPQRVTPAYARLLQQNAPQLESLDDSRGPALAIYKVGGGTNVLKSQAACAFQAFARYRLGAEPMSVPGPGLDAAERGTLLHKALYRLYGELPDRAAIVAKDAAALAAVIRQCVDSALHEARARQPEVFNARFLALEQERLSRLIQDWLQREHERAPFSVEQRELDREVTVGSLQLNTRVDRLDRLAGGGYAIIDYKTGDAKPSAWQGERPDEPQLPCYAVTAADDIAAVLFAVLRPGETGYRGYARDTGTVPDVAGFHDLKQPPDDCANWQALFDHWRTVLTRLAGDYAAGAAQVAPKDRYRTCRVCHLAGMCRIDEIQALGEADDD